MTLRESKVGSTVRIENIDMDSNIQERLKEIGIYKGKTVFLMQKAGFDGLVLASNHQRYAVDGKTAKLITVSEN